MTNLLLTQSQDKHSTLRAAFSGGPAKQPTNVVDSKAGGEAKLAFWSAIIVPVIVIASFNVWLLKYSYNFPFFDDFEIILDFLNRYLTTTSGWQKMQLLFAQHSEHRVMFVRLVALLEYYLAGKIDFRSLVLIGNAALPIILIVFHKTASKTNKLNPLHLAPLALILFNFRYFETSFWACAALQNIWVLAFAFLALYFLFQAQAYSVVVAGLFGWFATFTSGNGAAAFVAGVIVLALNGQLLTRKGAIWGGFGVAAVIVYFYGYVKPQHHPAIIQPLLQHPLSLIGYVLAFLGGVFTENVTLAVVIGCLLLGFMTYLTAIKYFQRDPIVYSLIAFLLMTSLLAGLARFGFGVEQALSSRYAVVSSVVVAGCYAALIGVAGHRIRTGWLVILLGGALCFHVSTYAYLPAKAREKARFQRDFSLVSQGRLSQFSYGWQQLDPRKKFPREVLGKSNSLGYFRFQFKDEAEILRSLPSNQNDGGAYGFRCFTLVNPDVAAISGWAVINGVSSDNVISVIRLKSAPVEKYIVLHQIRRTDIPTLDPADHADHAMAGFTIVLNREEIPPGEYRATLFLAASDSKIEIEVGSLSVSRSEWQFQPASPR